jgi:hypothetical protein
MKLKIMESRPIDDLFKLSQNALHLDAGSSRRKFLKLAGMAGIGASVAGLSNLLLPEKAYGRCFRNYYGGISCDDHNGWYYQHYQQEFQPLYGPLSRDRFNNELKLASSHFRVHQPMSGYINLINDRYHTSSGYLSLTLVDYRSPYQLEDHIIVPYTIRPRDNLKIPLQGPSGQSISGQSKGDKKLTAWTARDNRSSSLTVYA